MANTKEIDRMPESTRELLKARQKFVFENKHRVRFLGQRVARTCKVSQSTVSLTLNGKAFSIPVIQEAYRLVSLAMAGGDLETLKAVGAFQPDMKLSPEVEYFVHRFNVLREKSAILREKIQAKIDAQKAIDELRDPYLDALAKITEELDSIHLPDSLDSYIRSTLPTLPTAGDFTPSYIPGVKHPDESDIDFAIRQLKEVGSITPDGHLPEYHPHPDLEPGSYIDEETGSSYVIGRS